MKPVPTSADSTVSFAELKPELALPQPGPKKPGPDATVSLAETPAQVQVANQAAAARRPMSATGQPAPGRRANATLFGLPPAKLDAPGAPAAVAQAAEPPKPSAAAGLPSVPKSVFAATLPAISQQAAPAVTPPSASEASVADLEPAFSATLPAPPPDEPLKPAALEATVAYAEPIQAPPAGQFAQATPVTPTSQQLADDQHVVESQPPVTPRGKPLWRHLAWAAPIALAAGVLYLRASDDQAQALDASAASVATSFGANAANSEPQAAAAAVQEPSAAAVNDERTSDDKSADDAPQAVGDEAEEPGAAEPSEAAAEAQVGEESEGELDATKKVAAAKADKLVDEGHALRKKGKLRPARTKYRAALGVYPGYPRAVAGLLQLALQQRDAKQAVSLATQLVQQRPSQLSYQVMLGDAYKLQGKTAQAREVWQAAAAKGSSEARARLRKLR